MLECMRRSLPRIRAPACAAHVSRLMRASYRDSRLDGLLMSRCDADVERSCIDRRSALGCLKARLAKVGSCWCLGKDVGWPCLGSGFSEVILLEELE